MIKSILSFFSGNNDLAKGIVNTVDEAFYTNQEAQADTRGFIFSWLSATGPAASTRQFIAIALTVCFLLCIMSGLLGKVLSSGWFYLLMEDQKKAKLITDAMKASSGEMLETGEMLGPYFLLILAFYFAIEKVNGAFDKLAGLVKRKKPTEEK